MDDVASDTARVVLTTTDTEDAAEELASGLVRERLAACVQIVGPIKSVYRWDGDIQVDPEWQLWVKTTADRTPALTAWLTEHHSYDVPEILAMPLASGSSPDYLTWVVEETRPPAP